MHARVILALLLALGASACAAPAVTDDDAAAAAALAALPACTGEELPAPEEPIVVPDGARLPEGIVLSERLDEGALVQLTGFVARTPVEIRAAYAAREDLERITLEDEVFEAEILVSDGEVRTYVRATALCATGSAVIAVVAAEEDAGAVPVPAGGARQDRRNRRWTD